MAVNPAPRRRLKTSPPGETGQEALYLRSLSERQTEVAVKLRGGETVRGWIEYFDDGMLRLTRDGLPNLFIYKRQILSLTEAARHSSARPFAAPGAKAIGEANGTNE
jgi:host factor-I protein